MPSTITEAAARLRAGTLTAVDLVAAAIANADRFDDVLRVHVARFDDEALEAARAADRDLAAGIDRGPLQGIPIALKDNILSREGPTTGGSAVTNPLWAEQRDATVVTRLREAGAVITGKTTMLELAVGVPDANHPQSEVRNPWDTDRWAGGSSSGNGAGLAAGCFLGALGSDTGGSIRVPAAYCGVTGFKQTSGLVPRTNVIPLGITLDVVGPMARSAADVAAILAVIAGPDGYDPMTTRSMRSDLTVDGGDALRGLRIGVERKNHLTRDLLEEGVDTRFEEAAAAFSAAGAIIKEVEIPYYQQGVDASLISLFAEGLADHNKELREQWDRFTPATRGAFASGALLSAGDYVVAQKARRVIRNELSKVFDDVDVIICPTAVTSAPILDGFNLAELVSAICTSYWNAVGNPVISVPMGYSSLGLPLGLQIAGHHFDEARVLRVAAACQELFQVHMDRAPILTQ